VDAANVYPGKLVETRPVVGDHVPTRRQSSGRDDEVMSAAGPTRLSDRHEKSGMRSKCKQARTVWILTCVCLEWAVRDLNP
jgi:hypothetical protein